MVVVYILYFCVDLTVNIVLQLYQCQHLNHVAKNQHFLTSNMILLLLLIPETDVTNCKSFQLLNFKNLSFGYKNY